jgi:CubicO group peptidase (beta-lactamase class C family)
VNPTPLPPPDDRATAVREILLGAVRDRATPAAVVEVGRHAGPTWAEAFGQLEYGPGAPRCNLETIFDLASLTKVIATASIAMRAVEDVRVTLDTRVCDVIPAWSGADRRAVTMRHLLDHSSGLPAQDPLWKRLKSPADVEAAICHLPLERAPGTAAVYSDVGFILLGRLLERALGAGLDELFEPVRTLLGGRMSFVPHASRHDEIAPTEFDPWRNRLLRGEVHDENAALLGGVAAHAGLFGTAGDVGAFARLVLETFRQPTMLGRPETMRTFAARSQVPGSSRALAWDTMLPTSSCGTRLTPGAIGHTGFTGTSLWIDPELDLYVVLLSNRVHPTRTNNRWQPLRPRIHDAVVDGFLPRQAGAFTR